MGHQQFVVLGDAVATNYTKRITNANTTDIRAAVVSLERKLVVVSSCSSFILLLALKRS